MNFLKVSALPGPNIWARLPVIEARFDGGEWAHRPLDGIDGFLARMGGWLPGAVSGLPGAAGVADAVLASALELQKQAGAPASFGCVSKTGEAGVFAVVFEYRDEALGRECLETARELCQAAAEARDFDIAAAIARLRASAAEKLMGPSTRAIVEAAVRRGIPFHRLDNFSLVQLGYGAKQRRIRAAETDRTGAIAEGIAQDKDLTRTVLQAVGVPVPPGYPVHSEDEAWETAEYVGLPAVVKPRDGNQGRGVATNLTTREQVAAAYRAALKESPEVIVEKHAPGSDHRILVIGGKVVAASRREPAHVIGDGARSIRALVDEKNLDPRRSDHHANILSKLPLDEVALQVLASQGYTPESVPPAGEKVLIRRNANLSTGGTATDVTGLLHPAVAAHAVEAAFAVGLDVAGVDVVARDISVPLEEQDGVVVEVNAAPGLRMHIAPSEGLPRDPGQAIVDMLFPPGADGRIPIVAVTGTNGKTTVTRFLTHILRGTGAYVGMTCTDGIFLNDRRIFTEDCSGPVSARMVLMNPKVEAAVFETARGGILRAGLGFDQCQVAVVTNIADGDHLGYNGVETVEELARVKRTIVEAVRSDGAAVLNAADPLVVAMAPHCPGRIVYFGLDGAHPVIAAHRAGGGCAIFARDGAVVLAQGDRDERWLALDAIPLTFGGRVSFEVENALAALGAAWAMGISRELIAARAASFSTDMDLVPGRLNVLRVRDATVLVDYSHNVSALRAITGTLDLFPHGPRSTMYTMAGDRRDSDIERVGEMLGDAFDRVIIYEAYTIRGRTPGEIGGLLRRGLERGSRVREVKEIDDPIAAMQYALDSVEPGGLLLLQPNEIDQAVDFVRAYGVERCG